MPKIEFSGIEKYEAKLRALGDPKTIQGMCKYSIYDAAGYVLEELKNACPVSDDDRSSGELRDSIITTPMKDEDGFIYEKLSFGGYDSKGVPNILIARAIESGRSTPLGKVGKHPFVRKTVERCAKQAEQLMDKAVNKYLSNFMKKEK